ncbi:MAG: hypothetical protein SGJ18_12330 [Pseudomonadota bacterium]|mgnify:CR=1 FL=1|nr:hypothetical protein [Pseudomonadota bacterium]
MVEALKRINPEIKDFQETPITTAEGKKAWHVTITTQSGLPLSGGFGRELDQARKIAACEFVERSLFQKFKKDEGSHKAWALDTHPTVCGFAAGFDRNRTVLRSVLEALERWALSQWIDHDYAMDEMFNPELDGVCQYFVSHFSHIRFFKKSVAFYLEGKLVLGHVGFVVGFSGDGAFPGSTASLEGENLWEHSLLEAFRHLLIFRNSPSSSRFPYNRIFHFAKNAGEANSILDRGQKRNWLMPHISFFNETQVEIFYLARMVFLGWTPWHLGPANRFLY